MRKETLSTLVKLFFAGVILVAMATKLVANPIDAQKAKSIAQKFFSEQASGLRSGNFDDLTLTSYAARTTNASLKLVDTKNTSLLRQATNNQAYYFVFNRANNGGYVIVAGDDAISPILGYSLTGNFDLSSAPNDIKSFFVAVNHAIEEVMQKGYSNSTSINALKATPSSELRASLPASVAPLLGEMKWNQSFPWDDKTPTVDDGGVTKHTPVGCVATATSQIMRFHKWPETGVGTMKYSEHGRTHEVNFANSHYDYSKMPLYFNESRKPSQDEIAMLSTFCYEVGVAVKMNYELNGSGAFSPDVSKALRDFFRYDKGVTAYKRSTMKTSEWYKIIYTDIANGLPVYYAGAAQYINENGRASYAGHAFVFDGYDSNGNVHVNWGWGGLSNGYFNMNILSPGAIGIGGGADTGYKYFQDCIVGIKPDKNGSSNEPQGMLLYDNFTASVDNDAKTIKLNTLRVYPNDHPYTGSYGVAIVPLSHIEGVNMQVSKVAQKEVTNVTNLDQISNTTINDLGTLKDGYYLVYPVYKKTTSSGAQEWESMTYSLLYNGYSQSRHLVLKVSDNGTKWEEERGLASMQKTVISFKINKAKASKIKIQAQGVAWAKQTGLSQAIPLDGKEHEVEVRDEMVSLEGFYTSLTMDNAGIEEIFPEATETIKQLSLRNNEIKAFEPGSYPNLEVLDLAYNNINYLNAAANSKLHTLNITGNKFTSFEMGKLADMMPKPNANFGKLYVREKSDNPRAEKIRMFVGDINRLTAKNWRVYILDPQTGKPAGNYKGETQAIDDINKANVKPRVYPVPAQDKLNIENLPMGSAVELFTLTGNLVISTVTDANHIEIDVTNLPQGQYILRSGNFVEKVVITK